MVLSLARWQGKVAIVTGASAGIGAAIAEQLVEAGVIVAGFARRSELIQELAKKLAGKKGELHAIKVDLTKEEDILSGFLWVINNLGPVSILINNAGTAQSSSLCDGDTAKWRRVLDVNVLGLCIATRQAVRIMRAHNIDGHIIHINSVLGHSVQPIPNYNIYPASKFAVTALTETLRQELNALNLNIKISSVSPGVVSTEFLDAGNFTFTDEEWRVFELALSPEEVADAVLYVLSTPPHVQVHELILTHLGGQ